MIVKKEKSNLGSEHPQKQMKLMTWHVKKKKKKENKKAVGLVLPHRGAHASKQEILRLNSTQ